MRKRTIITHALANSLLTTMYIILVATFMQNGSHIFGPDGKTVIIPIILLSVFVFSAAVCATLFFGYPLMWYLDGHKKDAVKLVGYTILFFFITTLILFTIFYFVK